MDSGERERLRRLAVWLACRRETDEALIRLTRYGPSASQQVATHLTALRGLLRLEATAFGAVEACTDSVLQRELPPLPQTDPAPHRPSPVVSLERARGRRGQP